MDPQCEEMQALKTLVVAVVERAWDDAKLEGRLAAQAIEWIAQRGSIDAWSFEWCCAILKLDPDAVRRQIVNARKLPSAA